MGDTLCDSQKATPKVPPSRQGLRPRVWLSPDSGGGDEKQPRERRGLGGGGVEKQPRAGGWLLRWGEGDWCGGNGH